MERLKKTALAFLLLSIAGGITGDGGKRRPLSVTEKDTGQHGIINWTRLELTSIGESTVNRDSDTYPLDLQTAYENARRAARRQIYMMLLSFRVDSTRTVKQILSENPGMRTRLQNHIYTKAYEIVPPYRRGNMVSTRAGIRLTGADGLYSLFPELYPFFRVLPPTVFLYRGGYDYSGLVIDARHLKVRPSSGLRIFNEKGILIFSPAFTRMADFRRQGHLQYLPSLSSSLLRRRVGSRPLYFLAKSLSANSRAGTDIVIHDRDGDRILSSRTLHNALKRCRVVIICRSIK